MNILLLGGVRFSGKAILEKLCQVGHEVSVLTRGNLPVSSHKQITHICADRKNAPMLDEVLGGQHFDCVVDNNAYVLEDVKTLFSLKNVKFDRYIFTSSAWVNKIPLRRHLHPQTITYLNGKLECEDFIKKFFPVPFRIIRPGIILGEGDHTRRTFFYLFRIFDGQEFILADGGKKLLTPVYVKDVAEVFLRYVDRKFKDSKILELVDDHPIAIHALIDLWCRNLKKPNFSINIAQEILKEELPEYCDAEPFCLDGDVYDSGLLREELGFRFTPQEIYFAGIVEYFMANSNEIWKPEDRALRESELKFLKRHERSNAICHR